MQSVASTLVAVYLLRLDNKFVALLTVVIGAIRDSKLSVTFSKNTLNNHKERIPLGLELRDDGVVRR